MSISDDFNKMPEGFNYSQAVAEADRCLLCHDAPCSKGCPADTKPGDFIRKFRLRNVTGAIRTIKENNILGGACGVLCPTERLCEKECSAKLKSLNHPDERERPIQIGKIQRFLVEHSWEMGFKVLEPEEAKAEKVAIVGSGPAGLSCAAELAKAGYKPTVFEAKADAGGMIRYGVVPFRFDLDFLGKEMEDIKSLGVEFKFNSPIEGQSGVEDLLNQGYSAVFIGTGLWSGSKLETETVRPETVFDSIDYLSGLRDGRVDQFSKAVKGKTVAVIGGGATAMDCIESAVKLGAKDVYLVYRRSFLQMPAELPERLQSLQAGVHYLLLNQPIDFVSNSDGSLRGLKLIRTKLGDPDDSGRRRPVEIMGSEWVLEAEVVIEAIGNQAEKEWQESYPNVKVNEKNLVVANSDTCETSVKGIFAGGDIVRGPALVVKAVQDGKNAAKSIINYLSH